GDVTQYSIDQFTGLLYSFGSVVSGSGPIIASPDPTGRFLYSPNATGASINQYSIDPFSGQLRLIQNTPTSGNPSYVGLVSYPASAIYQYYY
ncbi:MAG TPA: hypothetical protein PK881_13615, partial [Leptospiraceae bacterium]|nr:hypothetical protein [Leptospiraceae bacterium]